MTEIELLQRAKMYMDKLANGIDPITNQEAPCDDIINNVRLSRCFFYVSDVLGKCIQNGGTEAHVRQPAVRKQCFRLSPEQREQCLFTEEPVTISVLNQRINNLIDTDTMQALKYSQITDWLVESGLLDVFTTAEGRHVKKASAGGEGLGICNEERMGQYGPYTAVVYREPAQRFILDNLDSILSFGEEKIKNEGAPWSAEENELLLKLFREGKDPTEIGDLLKRKASSVKRQLKKIGLV